ncbi:MAG: PEGA domain-containing protein [Deltaproteobacteria bacterium]|nr:PEGA domain-containing protein [Deltaproteobacteria bacterium]
MTAAMVWVGLAALATPTAMAQTYTVLPVERDSRVPAHERSAAFSAVRSARVLGPQAEFVPVGPLDEVLPTEERALSQCLEVDCAARLARGAGLDLVIVVAVWPPEGDNAGSVAVTLVEASGAMHEADAEIGSAGVSQAATTALVAAARRMSLGDGVELRVRSTPDGALVVVDGTDVGVTPFVGVFEAGDHRVEVRLHGEEDVRDVTLVDDAVTMEVVLGPDGGLAGGGAAPGVTKPSIWNFILGGGAIAVGVVALIAGPIQAAARSGEVTEPMGPDGEPRQTVHFGGTAIALTILSVALLAGGTTVMILQPLTTESGDVAGATLELTGSF